MPWLEILVASSAGLKTAFVVFEHALLLMILGYTLFSVNEHRGDEKVIAKKFIIKLCVLFFLVLPFALMPRIEDVWKVRIALIKFELASPDNIKKGTDHPLLSRYLLFATHPLETPSGCFH